MRLRALLTNLIVAFLSLLVGVAGMELLLRALRPFDLGIWDVTREGLVVLVRNRCLDLPRLGRRICTNSLGMRDVDHALDKPPGSFRILVLGDSFMEALQVPLEDSFPRLLEGRLNDAQDLRVEVVSAGVSGWGTDDELAYLELYGLHLRPDLVLVALTLHNDVSDNLAMEWRRYDGHRLTDRPLPLISTSEYLVLRAKIWLASHSHLYQVLLSARRARRGRAEAQDLGQQVAGLLASSPPPSIETGWSMTEALLDRLARTSADEGARFAVVLIPLWVQIDPTRLDALLERQGLARNSVTVEGPQRRVMRWGETRGVPVIDLLSVFAAAARGGPAPYLEGDGHWTEAGHRLAAEEVSRQLVERDTFRERSPWAP